MGKLVSKGLKGLKTEMIRLKAIEDYTDPKWKDTLDADWNNGLIMLKPTHGEISCTRLAELDRSMVEPTLKVSPSFPVAFLPGFSREEWIAATNSS